MPTDTATLRALLIKQGKEQQAEAIAREKKEMAKAGKKGAVSQPRLTDDDWAFDQATTLLWNPLVGPQLRAALYKVLADTPGVRVDNHARDGLGRAAVEISRTATSTGIEDQAFENPGPGRCSRRPSSTRTGTRGPTCTCR
jgi:hypothetical protein